MADITEFPIETQTQEDLDAAVPESSDVMFFWKAGVPKKTAVGDVASPFEVSGDEITGNHTAEASDIGATRFLGNGSGTITIPADVLGAALPAGKTGTITFVKTGTGTHTLAVSGPGASRVLLNASATDNIQQNETAVVVVKSATLVAWATAAAAMVVVAAMIGMTELFGGIILGFDSTDSGTGMTGLTFHT